MCAASARSERLPVQSPTPASTIRNADGQRERGAEPALVAGAVRFRPVHAGQRATSGAAIRASPCRMPWLSKKPARASMA